MLSALSDAFAWERWENERLHGWVGEVSCNNGLPYARYRIARLAGGKTVYFAKRVSHSLTSCPTLFASRAQARAVCERHYATDKWK